MKPSAAALLVGIAVLLTGCPGLKRHSVRNAPGIVELDTPPARLTLEPQQDPPGDPGIHQLGLAPGFWVMPGFGRMYGGPFKDSALEMGVQLHVSFGEDRRSGGKSALGYPMKGWGATLGWGIVQFGLEDIYDSRPPAPTVMGPITLEATRHYFYAMGISAGLVLYPTPGAVGDTAVGGVDVGGQISVFASVFAMRMRYVEDSGFEFFGGYQVWLPSSLTWSR